VVALRQPVVARPQWANQHLSDGNRCHGKAQPSCRVRGKQRRKARPELWMVLKDVNDRRESMSSNAFFRQVVKF
jgi:hypothetical protein